MLMLIQRPLKSVERSKNFLFCICKIL